jgi:glycine/D-amino acid oxidase-like deaminating enzyme
VVDPRRLVAAAAGRIRAEGPQPRFETGKTVPGEAVFLEYREPNGTVLAPELFPRADVTTYVCAISTEEPLPIDPTRVAPDPGAIERLEVTCSPISSVLASAKILVRQACYRPVTSDGLPLIGPVPEIAGAYVATGTASGAFSTRRRPARQWRS